MLTNRRAMKNRKKKTKYEHLSKETNIKSKRRSKFKQTNTLHYREANTYIQLDKHTAKTDKHTAKTDKHQPKQTNRHQIDKQTQKQTKPHQISSNDRKKSEILE